MLQSSYTQAFFELIKETSNPPSEPGFSYLEIILGSLAT